jgi:acetylornithine deacetylase/succinyl-diaminopimelate desuccinylase-like protein
MRKLTILFVLAALGIVGIAAGVSKNTANAPKAAATITKQQPKPNVDPVGTINGAVNPEQIPDHVAYSLLFNLIAGRQTEAEQNRIRAYIRQVGLGGADVDTLITTAEEFRQRVSILDKQAAAIKDRHFFKDADGKYQPNGSTATSEERTQLQQLQRQRESIVADIVASLQQRLSADGFAKARQHVNERVKHRIKIFAS